MQRPGFDHKRLMADGDEMFWKSLMPPRKRKKVQKNVKKKKKFSDANLKKKSRKTDKGKKREKKEKKKLSPTQPGPSHVTEETKTKKKRKKKKSSCHLPPPYILARHPEVVVSPERVAPADPDSQVDDINSQDLFITQKTFRASPLYSSSEEFKTPPQPSIRQDKARTKERVERTSTATQTENFFTSEMSSFLHFQQSLSVVADVQPLDLSLPHGRRSDAGPGSKSDEDSVSSNESEPKTASSDDSESTAQVGRADVSQVRAVQTRLDKSFFFKTKGETQPPRPETPLMKRSEGIDKKSKKKIN